MMCIRSSLPSIYVWIYTYIYMCVCVCVCVCMCLCVCVCVYVLWYIVIAHCLYANLHIYYFSIWMLSGMKLTTNFQNVLWKKRAINLRSIFFLWRNLLLYTSVICPSDLVNSACTVHFASTKHHKVLASLNWHKVIEKFLVLCEKKQ